jgi:hypothetical protein
MAKRETFTAKLVCPKCGKTGTATFEENENPMHTGGVFDRTLESMSAGFHEGPKDPSVGSAIFCDKCKVRVPV